MFFFFMNLIFNLIQRSLFLNNITIFNFSAKVFFNDVVLEIFSDVLLIDDVELFLELTDEALNDFVDEEGRWLLFKVIFDYLRFLDLWFIHSEKWLTLYCSNYSCWASSNINLFLFNNSWTTRRSLRTFLKSLKYSNRLHFNRILNPLIHHII